MCQVEDNIVRWFIITWSVRAWLIVGYLSHNEQWMWLTFYWLWLHNIKVLKVNVGVHIFLHRTIKPQFGFADKQNRIRNIANTFFISKFWIKWVGVSMIYGKVEFIWLLVQVYEVLNLKLESGKPEDISKLPQATS